MDFFDARELRGQRAKDVRRCRGEKEAEAGADEREEKRFGKELSNESAARSAQGETDRDFVLTTGGTGKKQSDNIGAGDEEQQSDGAEEQPERASRIGDGGFLERLDADGEIAVGFGKLAAKLRLYGREIGTGLRDGDAGLEASDNSEPVVFARLTVGK